MEYISDLLMKSMTVSMTRSRETMADLDSKNKEKASDADGLYRQLLEAQSELKKKDAILDQTEKEFNRVKDAEEEYRDQIDLLQNELSELRRQKGSKGGTGVDAETQTEGLQESKSESSAVVMVSDESASDQSEIVRDSVAMTGEYQSNSLSNNLSLSK